MNTPPGLLIRDGVPTDIPGCLALAHDYDTDFVWQVNMHGDNIQRNITLRQERLPRQMAVTYPSSERRLRYALSSEHAFIVVTDKDGSTRYAYLVMIQDPTDNTARLRDIVVDAPYRRAGVGTRLLKIAQRWAQQRGLSRIYADVQTKNYPAGQLVLRSGYTFCGFHDQYFDNQDIAIFFCLALN